MPIARSKVTARGQISVPLGLRQKLGVGPGSILEWDEEGDKIVVRRVRTFTSEDIHRAIFGGRKPKKRTESGSAEYIRDRYARH